MIEARGLTKRYGSSLAVDHVNPIMRIEQIFHDHVNLAAY